MNRLSFFIRFILFPLPLLALFGSSVFISVYAGEAMPLTMVHQMLRYLCWGHHVC